MPNLNCENSNAKQRWNWNKCKWIKEGELGFERKNEGWNDLVGMKAGTGRFVKRDQ